MPGGNGDLTDGYQPSDQVMAAMASRIVDNLSDPSKLPYMGSISKRRARRCLRQLNLVASYPTPLIIQATLNELKVEAAVQGTRPGGRAALMLKALQIVSGQGGKNKGGLISRFLSWAKGDKGD